MDDPASPCLVDTNILVYALTPDDERSLRAQELITGLSDLNALRTSTQVLQELYSVSTLKLKNPLTPKQALAYIDKLAACPVIINDVNTIREAARLSAREPISFWDAMLLSAAARGRCARLYTEDMQHGRTMLGVQIVNPFRR
jgi:predicted nucleic acid-binding protein